MIRWRVGNVVKGLARNGNDVLGNCKVVHALDREWKLLLRPAEYHLPNLTPFWANGNFGADSSGALAVGCGRVALPCPDDLLVKRDTPGGRVFENFQRR